MSWLKWPAGEDQLIHGLSGPPCILPGLTYHMLVINIKISWLEGPEAHSMTEINWSCKNKKKLLVPEQQISS